MKINRGFIVMMFAVIILSVGCSNINNKNSVENNDETKQNTVDENNMKEIENQIPYIDKMTDSRDNSIIDKRYENVRNEDLTYNSLQYEAEKEESESEAITQVYLADSIKDDVNYKCILEGFSYLSESNPCSVSYNEAIELIKKVLPDDIEKVRSVIDEEVNKEYIYYKSEKGNFRVGLCQGYIMTDEGEKVDKDLIVGIDYSKEIV